MIIDVSKALNIFTHIFMKRMNPCDHMSFAQCNCKVRYVLTYAHFFRHSSAAWYGQIVLVSIVTLNSMHTFCNKSKMQCVERFQFSTFYVFVYFSSTKIEKPLGLHRNGRWCCRITTHRTHKFLFENFIAI